MAIKKTASKTVKSTKSKTAKTPVKSVSKAKKTTVKAVTSQPKTSYNLLDKGPKNLHTPNLKKEFKQYFAEFVGTAMLTFAVTFNLSYGELVLPTALVAALTVMAMVYIFGKTSGANLNPAVTLALLVSGNMHYKTAIFYILAQVTGAMFAVVSLVQFNFMLPEFYLVDEANYFLLEAIGAALLVFGVMSVVTKKVTDSASGIVIGGSLLLGLSVAANLTLGILNPAIAISWNLVSYTYLLGPIVGGLVAAFIYKLVAAK